MLVPVYLQSYVIYLATDEGWMSIVFRLINRFIETVGILLVELKHSDNTKRCSQVIYKIIFLTIEWYRNVI